MIDQLTLLADTIEAALVDIPVYVTAGRPAAPSFFDADCDTRVYVFPSQVADFNQNDPNACAVDTRFGMQYELWTCYPEDWDDQVTSEEGLEAAQRLISMMQLTWCALVDAKDSGTFGDCNWVELEELNVQNRLGGAVNALGGVTISYDCPVETSPTSP